MTVTAKFSAGLQPRESKIHRKKSARSIGPRIVRVIAAKPATRPVEDYSNYFCGAVT